MKVINEKSKIEEDYVEEEDLVLTYVFKENTLQQVDNLKKAETRNGYLHKIVVEILIKINVYYNAEIEKFRLKSYQSVNDLQEEIV